MTELARIEHEIELCLNGTRDGSRHGDDWLWLLGFADWTIEREMLKMETTKQRRLK